MSRNASNAPVVIALFLSLLLCGPVAANDDLGEALIRKFFADATNHDVAALEQTLAEGFQSIHSDGIRDRAGELALIRKLRIDAHTLSGFETTRSGPLLVVTFEANVPGEVIDGKQVAAGAHARLAVFRETAAGWQLVAYANASPLRE